MEFKEYSFRSLLSEIIDNRGKTVPTAEEGIPLIATNCIKNETLHPSYDKVRYVSENTYETWFRGHPKPGDMVFTCKGSPGRVCWVPDPIDFCIAQDMVGIRANEKIIYPKYLFALLRSEETQNKILNMHVGSLIPHFKKGDFGNLYFDIPLDMEYQKKVGDTYFDFCLKIESNRKTNQTLEQIAQALFKSWFVDFEPTRAKIAAKESGASPEEIERAAMCAISGKTPDQLAQLPPETQQNLKTTAALFPDALVDSELGEIPKGWEILPLDGIAEIIMGQSPNGDSYNENGEGELLINGPVEFGEYHPKRIKWTTSPTKFSNDKDLIVCVRGSTTGRYVKSDGKYCLGRGVCAIRSKNNQQAFVDQLFKHCLEKLLTQATGSTFPSWNGPVLKSYKINASTSELRANYSSLVQEFENQISLNAVSIQDLSNLRDALLPKLLSGELTT